MFCYFVTMGGFRVSIEDIRPSPSAHSQTGLKHGLPDCIPLSPDGIRLLAELGHLNVLVEHARDIEDKIKGGTFQKCLVAGQLCWMVIQCITRKVQGLPISLLEVHTLAHAFFSVLLYVVWLKVCPRGLPSLQRVVSIPLIILLIVNLRNRWILHFHRTSFFPLKAFKMPSP